MVLGVTGGIATGKSSVTLMFGELGAVVVSADEMARQAVAPGSDALAALVSRFGRDVLNGDGTLNREKLSAIIFADAGARADLNAITHPAIAELAVAELEKLRAAGHPLIVYEAPLLFEASAESRVDQVLVVITDPETQIERLVARDGISRDEAQRRIDAQMPLAEKVSRADYVIDNSGPAEETRQDVAAMNRELLTVPGQQSPR